MINLTHREVITIPNTKDVKVGIRGHIISENDSEYLISFEIGERCYVPKESVQRVVCTNDICSSKLKHRRQRLWK